MIRRKFILTLKGMLLLANILFGSSDAQKVIRKVADSVVLIKSKSFIGLNSTLRNNIVVNEGCIVAASSNVTKTTEKGYLYMGNPAKNIRDFLRENK